MIATAPKDSKKDVTYNCIAHHTFNGKTDERKFNVVMKAAAAQVKPTGPACKINPELKEFGLEAGKEMKISSVINATTMKPVQGLQTECPGSKFSMECMPVADYMKWDGSNGMAYARNPKGLKVAMHHKCQFKQKP